MMCALPVSYTHLDVYKRQHRDRIAFLRICSGKFERGMEAFHVQEGKNIKLATGTSLMADDRAIVDEAYAGDIIGLFDPGIFSIGDTLCTGKQHVQFAGIPTFAPVSYTHLPQIPTQMPFLWAFSVTIFNRRSTAGLCGS